VRQLVLVVVLVGAAFLGGAFVNGPGLRWAQTQVLGSLGLEDGEIARVDLKGAPDPEAAPEKTGTTGPAAGEPMRGPLAPVPGIVAEGEAPKRGGAGGRGDRAGEEISRAPAMASSPVSSAPDSPPPVPPGVLPPRPGADEPRAAGARPAEAVAREARAPRDPDVARAAGAPGAPQRPAPAAPAAGEARPALLDSLASLMPAPAPAPPEGLAPPAPRPAPLPPGPRPAPEGPGADDWSTLARKMQGMGISRYTIEGQPGGRVLFSCLIPLAGRQAVTQRFEAEGDDALQAARAALRRVALWRATQSQSAH